MHNKGIRNQLDAWLTFLAVDEVESIIKLIEEYPEFKAMYEEVYEICQNVESVMEMFSKELLELDRHTVQYMIDEMQNTIDAQKGLLDTQKDTIDEQKDTIDAQQNTIEKMQVGIQEEVQKGIQNVIDIMRELNASESEIVEKLQSKYQLTKQQAEEYLK